MHAEKECANAPVTLLFDYCKWQLDPEQYTSLLSAVPAPYSTVIVEHHKERFVFGELYTPEWSLEHFKAVCIGVAHRVRAGRPVKLCVKGVLGRKEHERAQVLEYIEDQGLREWIEVDL